ncbi:Holliday junction resolvase RecU [Alicyclobacillus fodiniaquatilis]|uniref:Holliday junction resolvase RecU n=1 Tax=Alicyclobacillus fodiniaquatilis TaxID=1661150 RepID=A0ABW4JI62_9BACL
MPQGNRGMALETLISHANEQYRAKEMAVVYKRPTPVKILRTRGTQILKATLESASTVDYEGVYRGYSLQFEAKSTESKSSWALKNIHAHQIEHLRVCESVGAICFLILEFVPQGQIFYVPAQLVIRAWDAAERGGRKSIPYDDIAAVCYPLRPGRGVVLDYLSVVDELIRQTA